MGAYSIPDHPVIANMERTGYPDGKEPDPVLCPICGKECETIYRDRTFKAIVGCDLCIESIEPWEI